MNRLQHKILEQYNSMSSLRLLCYSQLFLNFPHSYIIRVGIATRSFAASPVITNEMFNQELKLEQKETP